MLKAPAFFLLFFVPPWFSLPLIVLEMAANSLTSSSDNEPSSTNLPTKPDPEGAVGLSNLDLSQGRRRLLDLMNRLFNTGVQADVDIPQIAVIGSQSAGKSSLIESISGITLPRAAGTCTRCPTECKLSQSSEPWKCIVSLRFSTDAKGQILGQVRNEVFGPPITDKKDVEERIRRAQRAILNPSTHYQSFLDGDDEDLAKAELTFSTNCVSLQISGPGVADLSFCDLPGLIASVGTGGHSGDIALVENLVASYISKPSCVILLTVACETDFENQGAHRLARQYDPAGKRTIGVLTKPDRIPPGEEARWLSFIRNETEPLENNWYCVKQPNSNDLKKGISWFEARQRENEFFSITSPWSEIEPMYQKYLRTANLIERASSILSDLISKRLPKIQEELQNSLQNTEESIRALPKEPSNDPFGEIIHLIHRFTQDLSKHVEGVSDEDGLLQAIRPFQEKFRLAIRSTAPDFRPYERRYANQRSLPKANFLSNEEGQDSQSDDEDDELSCPAETEGSNFVASKSPARGRRFGKAKPKAIYIDEVLDRALKARSRELPGNYPYVVQASYISSITQQWRAPAKILCMEVYKALSSHVKKIVTQHFASFGQGSLEQRVKVVLQDHLKKCCEATESKIEWLIQLEDRPFTLNTHYLSDYKDKFLSYYKGSRENDDNPNLMKNIRAYKPTGPTQDRYGTVVAPSGVGKVLAGLVEMGIVGVKPDDIPKLLPPDKMDPALTIMAEVRAYFQVAYKRFADNIPLTIDHELVRGLEREMLSTLYTGLGINGPNGMRVCKEFIQESPHVADRRGELRKKWERLNAASQELLHIGF